MQRKFLIALLLLLLPFSSALGISAWQADFKISPEGFSEAEILLVADSSSGSMSFADFGCGTISAYDLEGSLDSSLAGGQITIVPRERVTNYSFSIICSGANFTRKEKEWLFSADLPFPQEAGSIKVLLPENAFLIKSSHEGKIFVEGSRLSLIFDASSKASVNYSFENKNQAPNSADSSLLIFTGIALIILIAYFSLFYYRNKTKKEKGREKNEVKEAPAEKEYMKYLLGNEKKVVEALQREKRLTQRKLQMKPRSLKALFQGQSRSSSSRE